MSVLFVVLLAACRPDPTTSTDTSVTPTPTPTATSADTGTTTPEPATLVVTASTDGDYPDADGYLVQLDGGAFYVLPPGQSATIPVEPGAHILRLDGLAEPCMVEVSDQQIVQVFEGDTADVHFQVLCEPYLEDQLLITMAVGERVGAYSIRPDGTDLRAVDPQQSGVFWTWPTSADGRTVYAVRQVVGVPDEIWSLDAWGQALEQIHVADFEVQSLAVSPNGGHLALGDDDGDIHVYDLGTDTLTNVTNSVLVDEAEPSWSPDGMQIAFTRTPVVGLSRIWIMDADGTNASEVPTPDANAREPAWSPEGLRLAYVSDEIRTPFDVNPAGDFEVHVINLDGTRDVFVSNNILEDHWPAWSGDGAELVYTTFDDAWTIHRSDISSGATPTVVVENPPDVPFTTSGSWGR